MVLGFPGGSVVKKNPPAMQGIRRLEFHLWVGKIPWRRKCQPTPVFLPGKSHGQRSLEGYSPWGRKESDTTEQLSLFLLFSNGRIHIWSRKVLVVQLCPTFCDLMDCRSPGSSVNGIFQARILEWVVISYSRESSWPRDWTRVSCVSCLGRWILYHCTT